MTYAEYRAALAEEAHDLNAERITLAQYNANVAAIMADWREQQHADTQERYQDACGMTYSDADSGL